jgi:3-oxoacyl-[acyl-carrier protein] reductase
MSISFAVERCGGTPIPPSGLICVALRPNTSGKREASMDLGIAGRTAICAGASRGMGKASALALAREGVNLVISARGEARLAAAAAEIAGATGVEVIPVAADHATAEGRAALQAACPSPDILVITCSPPGVTPGFRDITPSDWQASLDTSFLAPVELMRLFLDGMVARRFGRVVNIATVAAKLPSVPRLLSGPSRSALHNYAVAVSKAVAKDNVIINTLLPGMFLTENLIDRLGADAKAKGVSYEEERDRFVSRFRVPAGKFGDPEDVGALAAMLCSRFGSYVVGQSLVMDGGLVNALF